MLVKQDICKKQKQQQQQQQQQKIPDFSLLLSYFNSRRRADCTPRITIILLLLFPFSHRSEAVCYREG